MDKCKKEKEACNFLNDKKFKKIEKRKKAINIDKWIIKEEKKL